MVIKIEISTKEVADLTKMLQGQLSTKEINLDALASSCVETMKKPVNDLTI